MTGNPEAPAAEFASWQAMRSEALLDLARAAGLPATPDQDRIGLLVALLEHRLRNGGTVRAEGVRWRNRIRYPRHAQCAAPRLSHAPLSCAA